MKENRLEDSTSFSPAKKTWFCFENLSTVTNCTTKNASQNVLATFIAYRATKPKVKQFHISE